MWLQYSTGKSIIIMLNRYPCSICFSCQCGRARQCFQGHVSFMLEKFTFTLSQKRTPSHITPKLALFIKLVELANFIASSIGWGRPNAYVKLNDSDLLAFDLFPYFSRNRLPAELSIAQTRAMFQTMRFDAHMCLFISLISRICGGIEESRIPPKPPTVSSEWIFCLWDPSKAPPWINPRVRYGI